MLLDRATVGVAAALCGLTGTLFALARGWRRASHEQRDEGER